MEKWRRRILSSHQVHDATLVVALLLPHRPHPPSLAGDDFYKGERETYLSLN
jgi:hypothetical protein